MTSIQTSTKLSSWRWRLLIGSTIVAATLIFSWLRPETRPYWDQLDVAAFRGLNTTLCLGEYWQKAWAIAGCRKFDIVAGGLLLALLLVGYREQNRLSGFNCVVSLILFVAVTLLTREVVSELIVDKHLGFHRPSPTLTLGASYRLSQLVPSIPVKDASPWSFPGDHGFVILSIVLYLGYLRARDTFKWAGLIGVILLLPRLIAGAHWTTDIVVGSGCMAIGAMALLMATPLHDAIVLKVSRFFENRRASSGTRSSSRTPRKRGQRQTIAA